MIKGLSLTIILMIVIAIFYIVDFYFMFLYDRERKKEGKGWAWDYTLFTIAIGAIILLQPILLPQIAWSTNAVSGLIIQGLGGVSIILSFILHIWSRQHLRHFYTERVEVQEGHQTVDTGPYAFVRHPIITSFFLVAGGIFLVNPGIITGVVLIYVILDFTKAAKQEETLLNKNVQGYTEYMSRVPRFFPRLWNSR